MKPPASPIAAGIAACLVRQPVFSQPAAECAARVSPCHLDMRLPMTGIGDSDEARDFLSAAKAAGRPGHRGLTGLVQYFLSVFADCGKALHENSEDLVESSTLSSPRACCRRSGARNTRPSSSAARARCARLMRSGPTAGAALS